MRGSAKRDPRAIGSRRVPAPRCGAPVRTIPASSIPASAAVASVSSRRLVRPARTQSTVASVASEIEDRLGRRQQRRAVEEDQVVDAAQLIDQRAEAGRGEHPAGRLGPGAGGHADERGQLAGRLAAGDGDRVDHFARGRGAGEVVGEARAGLDPEQLGKRRTAHVRLDQEHADAVRGGGGGEAESHRGAALTRHRARDRQRRRSIGAIETEGPLDALGPVGAERVDLVDSRPTRGHGAVAGPEDRERLGPGRRPPPGRRSGSADGATRRPAGGSAPARPRRRARAGPIARRSDRSSARPAARPPLRVTRVSGGRERVDRVEALAQLQAFLGGGVDRGQFLLEVAPAVARAGASRPSPPHVDDRARVSVSPRRRRSPESSPSSGRSAWRRRPPARTWSGPARQRR